MTIQFPDHYANAPVRVRNEIAIAAAPERIWPWLIRAADWPGWYSNSSEVRIEGGASDLSAGAGFTWRTFGVQVRSTVREFVPFERIAWDGAGLMLDVYHAWLIEPRPGGSWVLTEENQHGLAARAQALFMPNRMREGHDVWLAALKARAEAG
jgi:uncharacterized protein YndB with AHSA1/START domain